MAYWIDNADSYLCSDCGFECGNPNKLPFGDKMCPKCKANMIIRDKTPTWANKLQALLPRCDIAVIENKICPQDAFGGNAPGCRPCMEDVRSCHDCWHSRCGEG